RAPMPAVARARHPGARATGAIPRGSRTAEIGGQRREKMLNRSTSRLLALAAALLLMVPAARAHDASKYPDWAGQWQRVPDGGPPRYDPSKPDGRGQQAPLTEEYRRIHEASMADQAQGGQGLYLSSVTCIPMRT